MCAVKIVVLYYLLGGTYEPQIPRWVADNVYEDSSCKKSEEVCYQEADLRCQEVIWSLRNGVYRFECICVVDK